MTTSPKDVLETAGLPVRRAGSQFQSTCPWCDKPEHLYVNVETGAWDCKRCGESGGLWRLRQKLGVPADSGIRSVGDALRPASLKRLPVAQIDALHRALLADAEALAYCTETRRWTRTIIEQFKIGLRVDGRGKWIVYPWWRNGQCVGAKYRILPAHQDCYPERFEREPGCESVLFNVDALTQHDEIIMASGESDALALLSLGVENVVATTTGETSLTAASVDLLTKKSRVLLLYDADVAGRDGAVKIAKRLGIDRAWLLSLPAGVKDANDFLIRGGTRAALDAMLANAVQLDVPSVVSIADALDRLEAERATATWDDLPEMTPWASVNRRTGIWRPGNLITLSGPQGTGKTTFALNVARWWAERERPALLYCLEMTVTELVQNLVCAVYGVEAEAITPAVITQARTDLGGWPLYLGSNPTITGREAVKTLLSQAVRRYGLHLLIFDNLHLLARSIEHRSEEVGVFSKMFKLLAMEHEIPVMLIAQPRKLVPGKIMTPWDLKDSVDLFSDSDQILLLHRELLGPTEDGATPAQPGDDGALLLSPLTLVRLAKARHKPARDGFLYFEGNYHRFREVADGDVTMTAKTPPVRRARRDLDD